VVRICSTSGSKDAVAAVSVDVEGRVRLRMLLNLAVLRAFASGTKCADEWEEPGAMTIAFEE
jgi:hypothetical protein